MRSAHLKDIFRELWKNKGRFIAIFAIIALGTGFFAGVKVTCPDMQLTADKYFSDYKLMDIRMLSTYGFNKEDIQTVKNSSLSSDIMPAYTIDAIIKSGNEERVAKLHSIPLDKLGRDQSGYINQVRVVEGRLPQSSGECVVEHGKVGKLNLKLGDKLTINSGKEDKDISEYLRRESYVVVGFVETPYYLTFEKGTSTLGNGTVSVFAMIPEEDFNLEVYTDIYLTLKSTKSLSAFSEQYKNSVKADKEKLESLAKHREQQRYDEVYSEASSKISDAKTGLEKGEKTQKSELAKAQDKLDKGQAELEQGKIEYIKQSKLYKGKLASAEKQLDTAESKLDAAGKEYAEKLKLFNKNKAFMSTVQITLTEAALAEAKQKLDAGSKQLAQQKKLYKSSKAEGEKKLADAKLKLDKAEKDLEAGRKEFEEKKLESDSKLQKAREDIKAGEDKLKDIKLPKWYVTDRNNNQGYASYTDDTLRVDAISRIFPVFFFVVAAFVCLTTMTRMVEEERTQIGTLKALGYSNLAIASKYLLYAAMASIAGSAVGLGLGLKLLPKVITNAYGMLYRLPPTITPFRADYVLLITLGALLCTLSAVYMACYNELREQPSELMRPKAPKMGKRVLLERLLFIWSRLNFFNKVTVRNLFRYKKRLIMTLLGIAGCTSLMVAGFGLRDAISSIVPKQYEEIFNFHAMVIIDENAKQLEKLETITALKENSNTQELLNVRLKNYEAGKNGEWQKINLLVPEDNKKLEEFISLRKMSNHAKLKLKDEGVVIGEKLSDILGLKVGDRFTIKAGDFKTVEVKVSAINENYTLHYVYMTKALHKKVFGEEPELNCLLMKMVDTSKQAEEQISTELVKRKAILQTNFTRANKKNFTDMVGNLNSVVFVMIFSAGVLAFVVLYNLTNINITERIREIASIKVLGFYDLEVSEYVFRENIILTLINICIGLVGGTILNKFVMETSEIDVVMFGREIYWYSYVFAALLTIVFAILVNIVMHFKIKKISMIESLKSVE